MRFSPLPKLVKITLALFFGLATLAPLPFAIVLPGDAQNIFKDVITIKDTKSFPATGRIDLMSIRVTNPDTWIFGPELLYSWISGEQTVYPKSAIYPPGTSTEEENKQAQADMIDSQDQAVVAAIKYLQTNPEIMASPGLDSSAAKSDGATKAQKLQVKNIKFKVEETGGPSGGLVFAIGLVELLTETDLLKGRHIAGTGTIDEKGVVGAIGGINEKINAAHKAGVTLFLAPADNAEEISGIPTGIKVITVATLTQAISAIKNTSP